ncbi:hypothetical protein BH18ACI4_BH18ACI4_01920 [soil metagenome]
MSTLEAGVLNPLEDALTEIFVDPEHARSLRGRKTTSKTGVIG